MVNISCQRSIWLNGLYQFAEKYINIGYHLRGNPVKRLIPFWMPLVNKKMYSLLNSYFSTVKGLASQKGPIV